MTMSSTAQMRKIKKPMIERRRRERINECLQQLKTLILDFESKEPSRYSKMEKADILEMTVKHLKEMHVVLRCVNSSNIRRAGHHTATNSALLSPNSALLSPASPSEPDHSRPSVSCSPVSPVLSPGCYSPISPPLLADFTASESNSRSSPDCSVDAKSQSTEDAVSPKRYADGFAKCAMEVKQFLKKQRVQDLNGEMRSALSRHLENCLVLSPVNGQMDSLEDATSPKRRRFLEVKPEQSTPVEFVNSTTTTTSQATLSNVSALISPAMPMHVSPSGYVSTACRSSDLPVQRSQGSPGACSWHITTSASSVNGAMFSLDGGTYAALPAATPAVLIVAQNPRNETTSVAPSSCSELRGAIPLFAAAPASSVLFSSPSKKPNTLHNRTPALYQANTSTKSPREKCSEMPVGIRKAKASNGSKANSKLPAFSSLCSPEPCSVGARQVHMHPPALGTSAPAKIQGKDWVENLNRMSPNAAACAHNEGSFAVKTAADVGLRAPQQAENMWRPWGRQI